VEPLATTRFRGGGGGELDPCPTSHSGASKNIILSILIPTFNRQNALKITIENFVNQIIENNFQNEIELIVSDNASTDNTSDLLKEYKNKYPQFFQYNINNENLGYGGNIKTLEKLSNGDYLWFCGDDDIYNENILEIIQKIIKKNKPTYIHINYSDKQLNESKLKYKEKDTEIINTKSQLFRKIKSSPGFVSCNIFERENYFKIKTDNLIWRHYCKLLNYPEEIKSVCYKQNSIFVNRPEENNWFQTLTMFKYNSEIIYEIYKSTISINTKKDLLNIYKKHFLKSYIIPLIWSKENKQEVLKTINNLKEIEENIDFSFSKEIIFLNAYYNDTPVIQIHDKYKKIIKILAMLIPFSRIRKYLRNNLTIYLTYITIKHKKHFML